MEITAPPNPSIRRTAYPTLFFVVVGTLVLAVCVKVLTPFFSAIAWAVVLAVAFQAPWRLITRRLAGRPNLAAAVAVALIALGVLLPASFFVSVLAAQASDAAARIAAELKTRNVSSFADLVALPAVGHILDVVQERTGITPQEVQKALGDSLAKVSSFVAELSGGVLIGLLDAIVTFLTTIFLLFFLFRDGAGGVNALAELIPLDQEARDAVLRSLRGMLQAIFRGSLLCALIQGATGGIGWAIVGLPSPALAGAAMAVLSLLPVGGTAIVWLPGTLWLLSGGRQGAALFLFLWGAVATSFLADNVLKPILIGGAEELKTLVVFLGVFGGITAFGLLGIFIGPIALALASTLLDILRRHARRSVAA